MTKEEPLNGGNPRQQILSDISPSCAGMSRISFQKITQVLSCSPLSSGSLPCGVTECSSKATSPGRTTGRWRSPVIPNPSQMRMDAAANDTAEELCSLCAESTRPPAGATTTPTAKSTSRTSRAALRPLARIKPGHCGFTKTLMRFTLQFTT